MFYVNNITKKGGNKMLYLRASSIGGSCKRKIQLEYRGEEAIFSDYILKAFEDGNMHEPSVIKWFEKKYNTKVAFTGENQLTLMITPYLRGHPDGFITCMPENGKSFLLECKALRQRAVYELRDKGVKKSHPHYYMQIQLYMYGLKQIEYPVSGCYFVARNKEKFVNGEYDTHVEIVDYDSNFVELALKDIEELHKQISSSETLPALFTPEVNWECKYCGYLHVCHPNWAPQKMVNTDSNLELEVKLYELKNIQAQKQALEEKEKEIRESLLQTLPVGTTQIAGYVVKIQDVKTERFDTKAIRSYIPPEKLSEFIKCSSYKKMTVSEVE
jgi:CRISPR/Cas system-associated exonuclease Cas4 (RecB family)